MAAFASPPKGTVSSIRKNRKKTNIALEIGILEAQVCFFVLNSYSPRVSLDLIPLSTYRKKYSVPVQSLLKRKPVPQE